MVSWRCDLDISFPAWECKDNVNTTYRYHNVRYTFATFPTEGQKRKTGLSGLLQRMIASYSWYE